MIFITTSFFFIFLSEGFDFFWEDDQFLVNPEVSSVLIIKQSFLAVFDISTSLQRVHFWDRPLQQAYWTSLSTIFRKDVVFVRILRALFPALMAVLLFLALKKRLMLKECILAIIYLITFTELFISVLYAQDVMLYMNSMMVATLLTFFFMYLNQKSSWKETSSVIAIVFLARIASAFKHEGKLVLPIIFLFAILCRRDLFRKQSFWWLMIGLAVATFPLLCVLGEGECFNLEFGEELPLFEFILTFFRSLRTYVFVIGLPTLTFFVLIAGLFCYFHLMKRKTPKPETDFVIFCIAWLVAEFCFVYSARGADPMKYIGQTWQRIDFAPILFPLTLLIFSCLAAIKKSIFSSEKQKQFALLLLNTLIILAVILHAANLNSWRGGWGDYFLGWQTVGDFVDLNANNSVLVEPYNHGYPFYFRTNNSQIMLTDIANYSLLFNLSKQFTQVYVANRSPVEVKSYLQLKAELQPHDRSLYARMKKLIGRSSQAKFYVYLFVPANDHP